MNPVGQERSRRRESGTVAAAGRGGRDGWRLTAGRVQTEPVGAAAQGAQPGPCSELVGALRGRGTCALSADSACCTQKSTQQCRAVLLQLKALK